MKPRSLCFGAAVYPGTFIVVVGGGRPEIIKAVKKHGKLYYTDQQRLLADLHGNDDPLRVGWSVNSGMIDLIWVSLLRRGNAEDFITLSHEALHAAYHRLYRLGVRVGAHNHEALAYLHDYIVRSTLDAVKYSRPQRA